MYRAEKVATLDLVSNGRVEFGMGEGASITELGPFGREMEDKQAVWEDGVRCVMPMFTKEAHEFARSVEKLVLVDGEQLSGLMADFEVGVSSRSVKVPKVDSDYFDE